MLKEVLHVHPSQKTCFFSLVADNSRNLLSGFCCSELDKISHGGTADPTANSGTSDTISSNNTSAVNSDAEGEYSDSENIDGEEIAGICCVAMFVMQRKRCILDEQCCRTLLFSAQYYFLPFIYFYNPCSFL